MTVIGAILLLLLFARIVVALFAPDDEKGRRLWMKNANVAMVLAIFGIVAFTIIKAVLFMQGGL